MSTYLIENLEENLTIVMMTEEVMEERAYFMCWKVG